MEAEGVKEEEYNDTESIETVTFDDYIDVKETGVNNLIDEEQNVFSVLVQKHLQNHKFTIEPKCHLILFHKLELDEKGNIIGITLPSNSLCHWVGGNLYPP